MTSAFSSTKLDLAAEAAGYDSYDEDEDERRSKKAKREEDYVSSKPSRSLQQPQGGWGSMMSSSSFMSLNAYERHKKLINEYLLSYKGSTKGLVRDTSRDRTDMDVIRENHRFLWTEKDDKLTWEQTLAKKYYDRLFKEYCICDLSRYKENKIAMRWRTKIEVEAGRGQFSCGNRKCDEKLGLRTWEVDFGYVEDETKRNALVKVRLCPDCSYRLNYRKKRKEVTKRRKLKKKRKKRKEPTSSSSSDDERDDKKDNEDGKRSKEEKNIWEAPIQVEQERTREEDFSEYLEDLFL